MYNQKIISGIIEEYLRKFPTKAKENLKVNILEDRIIIQLTGNIRSLRVLTVIINVLFRHIISHSEDKFLVYDLTLAIEEALVNIYTHSYKDHQGAVEVEILLSETQVVTTIKDQGELGRGLTLEQLLKEKPADVFAESGRGIMLIRKIVDQMDYSTDGKTNVLRLTKKVGG